MQVKDPQLRTKLVSRCMIKSYQPQSRSEPAMGLLVPRAAAAAAASSGGRDGQLPDEVDEEGRNIEVPVDALEGDYNWDCEYSFDLVVSHHNSMACSILHTPCPGHVNGWRSTKHVIVTAADVK